MEAARAATAVQRQGRCASTCVIGLTSNGETLPGSVGFVHRHRQTSRDVAVLHGTATSSCSGRTIGSGSERSSTKSQHWLHTYKCGSMTQLLVLQGEVVDKLGAYLKSAYGIPEKYVQVKGPTKKGGGKK